MTATLVAALEYAVRGWPVFPLSAPKNSPAIPSAHPKGDPQRGVCRGECGREGHGFHDATLEAEQIETWWAKWPTANVGCPTGVAFDVLDIDHQDYTVGVTDLPDCETNGGPVVRSGGGKWHLYFAPTGLGRRIRFSEHCDWLGTNGYVVMPPSTHKSGGTYTVFASLDLPLTAPPAALLAAATPRKSVISPTSSGRRDRGGTTTILDPSPVRRWSALSLIGRMAVAPSGERNSILFWCACRIGNDVHDGKATSTEGLAALDDLRTTARGTGLDDDEIDLTIESGFSKGLRGERA